MEVYVGTVCAFPYNFAPIDWALCNGQQAIVQQYPALFAAIGIQYGGDGRTNFNLPNLCGRMAMHTDNYQYPVGDSGGQEKFTLNFGNMAPHRHEVGVALVCNNTAANSASPASNYPAVSPGFGTGRPAKTYITPAPAGKMAPQLTVTLAAAGATAPTAVDSRMPYLCVRYCISIYGEYPVRD